MVSKFIDNRVTKSEIHCFTSLASNSMSNNSETYEVSLQGVPKSRSTFDWILKNSDIMKGLLRKITLFLRYEIDFFKTRILQICQKFTKLQPCVSSSLCEN